MDDKNFFGLYGQTPAIAKLKFDADGKTKSFLLDDKITDIKELQTMTNTCDNSTACGVETNIKDYYNWALKDEYSKTAVMFRDTLNPLKVSKVVDDPSLCELNCAPGFKYKEQTIDSKTYKSCNNPTCTSWPIQAKDMWNNPTFCSSCHTAKDMLGYKKLEVNNLYSELGLKARHQTLPMHITGNTTCK